MRALNLYILLVLTIFFSCQNKQKEEKKQIAQLVNEWQGKQIALRRDAFDRPICIDIDDQLNKLNKFPADMTFQTFLLDKDNKVAVLGNPVHNTAVKDLYLKQITGKDNPNKNIPKTTAETAQTEINFGTFDRLEVKEATIEVKTPGRAPS